MSSGDPRPFLIDLDLLNSNQLCFESSWIGKKYQETSIWVNPGFLNARKELTLFRGGGGGGELSGVLNGLLAAGIQRWSSRRRNPCSMYGAVDSRKDLWLETHGLEGRLRWGVYVFNVHFSRLVNVEWVGPNDAKNLTLAARLMKWRLRALF